MRWRPNASSVGADLRRLFGRLLVGYRLLGLPSQTIGRTTKPGEGHRTPVLFEGPNRSKRTPLAKMGASHCNLVRAMGPECRCAVRNATATCVGVRACVWRVGVHRGVQPAATLHEGVQHVIEKAVARWGSLRVHGDGGRADHARGRAACGSARFRVCSRRPGRTLIGAFVSQPLRVASRGPRRLAAAGKCAPCRRASRPAPASVKAWPIGGAMAARWVGANAG